MGYQHLLYYYIFVSFQLNKTSNNWHVTFFSTSSISMKTLSLLYVLGQWTGTSWCRKPFSLRKSVRVWETARQGSPVSDFAKRHRGSKPWNKSTKETSEIILLEMPSVLFIFTLRVLSLQGLLSIVLWSHSRNKWIIHWELITDVTDLLTEMICYHDWCA